MTKVRTETEIATMRAGGKLLSESLAAVVTIVKPGVTMRELDTLAEKLLRAGGGEPSFKGYRARVKDTPFPSTLCISVNDEVVHGLGNRDIVLREGDIVGLDIGVWFGGLCTDMAVTVPVGKVSADDQKLIDVTRKSMLAGIDAVCGGAAVSAVGQAVQDFVKPYGYGIVRDLVGHGVGDKVHEDPHIPNYYDPRYDRVKFQSGMTVAIEPMLTTGDYHVHTAGDGWAVVTNDGLRAAHAEVTILITDNGYEFITPMVS